MTKLSGPWVEASAIKNFVGSAFLGPHSHLEVALVARASRNELDVVPVSVDSQLHLPTLARAVPFANTV